MMNFSGIYNTTVDKVVDCGTITADFGKNIGFTFRLTIWVMLILIFFQWWAIDRITRSKETHERKRFLISITLTFITGLIFLMIFIQLYWIYLSGIDF